MSNKWLQSARILATAILPLVTLLSAPSTADEAAEHAAHDSHAHHRQMMQAMLNQDADKEAIRIPDALLTTQDKEKTRLATEIVGDRIVVMDFVYTTCTTVCPVLSAIFSQVEQELASRLGEEIVLVSLTVDPLRDTPEQLKAYSQKFGASENWLWLTSDKQTMDEVLKELGAYTPNFEDHPSMVLVGDASTGDWSRFVGFPGANQIVDKVNELSAARMMRQHIRE